MTTLVDAIEADAQDTAPAGVEAGRASRPCDSTITAIYPVRYGYANLFDDIVAPVGPPPISTLLSAGSIAEGQGYVARLLRPGWIYIREEAGGSAMQIFSYSRTNPDGRSVVESFRKFLFTNGVNAQGGLTQDRSSGREFYPFVFVAKGVSEVSILYTQHELHPNVIDRLNGDADLRRKTMQRVNLQSEGRDAVKATAQNLSRLVEDYRERRARVFEEAAGVSLDILTTEASFEIEPENVARQIRNTECYGESSMLIALHDPVGRQVEIAQTHAKLAMWEQDHAALNLYPYMVGQFVEASRTSGNPDMVKAVNENIDLVAHQTYWVDMQRQFDSFASRRTEIARLYRAFMYPGEQTDEVGSLDRYFRYFFAENSDDETELQGLLDVAAPIFDGLMASPQGQEMLSALAENAHGPESDKPLDQQRNAYGAFLTMFLRLATQPQNGVDWARATAAAMDRLLNGLGAAWGAALANARYGAGIAQRTGFRLSAEALQNLITRIIPKVLDLMGLQIVSTGTMRYNSAELGRLVGRALEMNVRRGGTAGVEILDRAVERLERGQRLFDWGQAQRQGRLPRMWQMAEVEVTRPSGGRFAFVVGETSSRRIGILVDGSFTGLSVFFNIMAITSLTNQSRFSNANPLQRGSAFFDAMSFTAALSSLTVDLMVVARSGLQVAQSNVMPAAVAARFAPQIAGSAQRLGRVLVGKLPSKLIAVANFAGTVVSIRNAVAEGTQGNMGATTGHALVALGSGILFAQAVAAAFGTSAAASSTVIGLPIGVVIALIALVFVGIGVVLTLIYSKNPVELLLFQCFWGKSDNYAFWPQVSRRPPVGDRIRRALGVASSDNAAIMVSFRMEVQEFMNIFAMPAMILDRSGGSTLRSLFGNMFSGDRSYDIELILPQFVLGQSEVIAGVYTGGAPNLQNGQLDQRLDVGATRKFADAVRSALDAGRYTYSNGTMHIRLRVDFGTRANILWGYQPQPKIIVPMRILNDTGELRVSGITAGMLNDRPA